MEKLLFEYVVRLLESDVGNQVDHRPGKMKPFQKPLSSPASMISLLFGFVDLIKSPEHWEAHGFGWGVLLEETESRALQPPSWKVLQD